ncbi:MAG TPA: hypothetical protein VIE65_14440, partial [Methylobacter sp.]
LSDDPVLIKLAEQHDNIGMRMVSGYIGEPLALSPVEGKVLLDFIGCGRWRKYFDCNLQGLACDKDGNDFLTGWMSLDEFVAVIGSPVPDNKIVAGIFWRLQIAVQAWQALGADEVYFDGYKKVADFPRYSYSAQHA